MTDSWGREWLEAIKYDWGYYRSCENRGILASGWLVGYYFGKQMALRGSCALSGHVWESVADAENGSEEVWCERCGYSMPKMWFR